MYSHGHVVVTAKLSHRTNTTVQLPVGVSKIPRKNKQVAMSGNHSIQTESKKEALV